MTPAAGPPGRGDGATPRPWRTGPKHTLWRTWEGEIGRTHRPIAEFFDVPSSPDRASREINAAFALLAINAHDDLVAALQGMVALWDEIADGDTPARHLAPAALAAARQALARSRTERTP